MKYKYYYYYYLDGSEAEEVASLSGDVEIGRFGGQLHPLPHQEPHE